MPIIKQRGPPKDHFSKVWLRLAQQFQRRFFFNFTTPFFLFLVWQPSLLEVGITGHKFGRGPSKDHSTKVWLQLAQWFQKRRFLHEFPIGFYVKLSLAVVAILFGSLKCWTQFWKGTTQGSFQQSLVEIGSVVSKEKIFF